MTDRQPTYPGRVVLTPVPGQTNTFDLTMADSPTENGTPPTKANLLQDTTAALINTLTGTSPATVDIALSLLTGVIPNKTKMFFPDNQYGGIVSSNFNTINVSGYYTGYGTATGAPNTSTSWFLIHHNSNAGTVTAWQIARSYNDGKMYIRQKYSSVWGAWSDFVVAIGGAQIYHTTYTGTGTYGSSSPKSIVLPFSASLVLVIPRQTSDYGFGIIVPTSLTTDYVSKGFIYVYSSPVSAASSEYAKFSTLTLSLYSTSIAHRQLNASGIVYDVIAVG